MRNTKMALRWIAGVLKLNKIPFQITGGFAAKYYGSKRKLYDIDIEVPDKDIKRLKKITRRWIIYGPKRYKDKHWELLLLTLKYKGQRIDINGADTRKRFDNKNGEWIKLNRSRFSKAKKVRIYGIEIPLEPKKSLIAYKKKLLRGVDKKDLSYIAGVEI